MNISAFQALQQSTHQAISQQRLLDGLIKLGELCSFASLPAAAEAVRTLRQDYAMLLGYMKSGMTDINRENYFNEFQRKAYTIYDNVSRDFYLHHGNGYEAMLFQRLHQQPEKLAEVYLPFVEGLDGAPATISAILADPLASYQQFFDTIWTSGPWSAADRDLIYQYVMNDDAPRINRLTIVSATGLALLFAFDEQKFLLLLSVIEEYQVEVSIRALVMSLLAHAAYSDRLHLYPAIRLKFDFLRELTYFHPLVMAVQKSLLVAVQSPALALELQDKLPEQLERAHQQMKDIPTDATSEEIQQCVDDNPQLKKFRDDMLDMVHDYLHLQAKGVDLDYHNFSHIHEIIPFFHEASNWFCPFSFEHPLLFTLSPAMRFLGVIVQHKSCDTDRYAMVLAMAPHVPEIHIVKQDIATMEETHIEGSEAKNFIEQLSEEMEHNSADADKSLLTLNSKRLQEHVVSTVHDCFRFFTLFKLDGQTLNPFDLDLKLWKIESLRPIFEGPEARRELADWLFELEEYKDALDFYATLPSDSDICQRMAFAYEKLEAPLLAQKFYREALCFDPNDEWTLRQLIASYRNSGDLLSARDLLVELYDAYPDSLRYTRQLAEIHVHLADYPAALKLYTKLQYLRPDHLPTLRALAWCRMAIGHYDKAEELYLDLVSREEVIAEDYLNAGHCSLLQGDFSSAATYYHESLRKRNLEYAASNFFASDADFLERRGIDAITQKLIIDLLNI